MSWKCPHCNRKNAESVQECWNCGHISDIPMGFALEWTPPAPAGKYRGEAVDAMDAPPRHMAKGWIIAYAAQAALLLAQGVYIATNRHSLDLDYVLGCVRVLLLASFTVAGLMILLVRKGGQDAITLIHSCRPTTKNMSDIDMQDTLLEAEINVTVLFALLIASQITYYIMFFNGV